jgi:hypothetical protein
MLIYPRDSEDSLFESDDEGMPPLLPVEPSEAGSDAASPKAASTEPNTSNTALPASAEVPWATARNLYWARYVSLVFFYY